MLDLLFGSFILGGKTTLLGSITTSSSLAMDGEGLDYIDTYLLGSVTSLSSLLLSSNESNLDKSIQDTNMIVESMSLEELYEFKDLVKEKGESLKLHM